MGGDSSSASLDTNLFEILSIQLRSDDKGEHKTRDKNSANLT